MALRILVLTVVLLILGAIGWFVGIGEAVACGITAVVIYVYAMVRRFNGVQAARRAGANGGSTAVAVSMTSSASDGGGDCGDGGGACT